MEIGNVTMEEHKPFKLPIEIAQTIERYFDQKGTINSNPTPDYLRNVLKIAFDNDEPWGEIKLRIAFARQCNLVVNAQLNMHADYDSDPIFCLVCTAECESRDIQFVRYTKRIISTKFIKMRAVALAEHTLGLLYDELKG